jgi:ComF family protein
MEQDGFLRNLWHGVADLVFPRPELCAVCGRDDSHPALGVCDRCLRRLPFIIPPICGRCGRMLRLCAAEDNSCRECAREKFYFTKARAVCVYEGAARAYLHDVKFRRAQPLARALAAILAAHAREHGEFRRYEVIVPVPLHSRRLQERGFNQAEVLARAVGASLRRPVHPEALLRQQYTQFQSKLGMERRRENVHKAFRAAVPDCLAGRRVLLIDDILTTGYTASECASAILRAGAREVGVLTLANGVFEENWLVKPMDDNMAKKD